jgi:hypothetical protein
MCDRETPILFFNILFFDDFRICNFLIKLIGFMLVAKREYKKLAHSVDILI